MLFPLQVSEIELAFSSIEASAFGAKRELIKNKVKCGHFLKLCSLHKNIIISDKYM